MRTAPILRLMWAWIDKLPLAVRLLGTGVLLWFNVDHVQHGPNVDWSDYLLLLVIGLYFCSVVVEAARRVAGRPAAPHDDVAQT